MLNSRTRRAGSAAPADAAMPAHLPALSPVALARALQGADLDWELAPSLPSTHAELAGRARRGPPRRPTLLAADEQTAGRGRRGRSWSSVAGHSLLFSLSLPWRRDPAASAAVTLACGVALAHCLAARGVTVQVKWPNDLLLHGRKLAGILAELVEHRSDAHTGRGDGAGGPAHTLVLGVGMNLRVDAAQQARIDQPAAGLEEAAAGAAAREEWLAALALALLEGAQDFEQRGFAHRCAEFNRLCAYLGEPVNLVEGAGGAARQGILRGADEDGRLLLESDGRVLAMMSGDVSLRAAPARGTSQGEPP